MSFGSTRYGPHIAPAASDVTPGSSSAITCTLAPASARTTAVVRPDTPAPRTTTRSLPLIVSTLMGTLMTGTVLSEDLFQAGQKAADMGVALTAPEVGGKLS
ncbi:hypothetical protein GCM10010246_78480 [Streptomyces cuspidosporus]|uniref:Uncharacterized protein n=1 Tax=Streptomyces cuspidosporus TaxID=66882 RepID=A0ABP5U808_9ACTN